jgi:protein TonB
MTAPADIAWSRQLAVTSPRQLALWTTAATLIFAAHAGAAWLVTRQPAPPPVMEAASGAIEVDLAALGFSEADQVSAGDVGDPVQPVTANAVEPTTAEPVRTPPRQTTTPVTRAKPVEQDRPVEQAPAAQPAMPETAKAEAVEPTRPELPQVPSEAVIASLPQEVQEVEEPRQPETVVPETIQPVEQDPVEQEVAALVNAPLPTPRPDYKPAAMPRAEKPEPKRNQAENVRPRSGNTGRNQADARRGTAEGSAAGKAASRGENGGQSRAGNAAVSNYPGKVASRLRRSLRYPPQARRDRLRGEVHVSFTVNQSGGVASVRLARSSGSPVLDKAALDTVRRAAPFPPIPEGAGRSSWPFTVPLAFSR